MSIDHSNNASGRRPKEVTGRMVFVCLVAFFGIITAVNAVMIRAAVSTFGGVETESAYQAGLAFAQETAQVAAQDARHWHVEAHTSRAADGAILVEVSAKDADDRPLAGLQATARLVHPTDRRADRVVAIGERGTGQFQGTAMALAGQWDLVIELSQDGTAVFRSKNRIYLR